MPQTRYITTPIFYVNDKPHIGHVYTSTICDVWGRYMRFAGHDVFFLTGTDEHGQKVEKSATARGVTPQQLADENAAVFQKVMADFAISSDDFIRTTQPRHETQVQHFVKQLLDSGAIYMGEFEGWYDEGQEEYYTETKAKEMNYVSPISKKPLTRAREKNFYFRLTAFQKPLEEHFAKQPEFVRPQARRNEVLGRLREGLQDVPISRTNFTWGIPMPNDPAHVVYVWVDALFNYITALNLGEPSADPARTQREKYWPATYHVVGKEILWFHAIIWPAMLMALKLPLPRCVYAHSFWISEGQKMSKTLGNFIDQETMDRYIATYSLDAFRYYLATQGPLGAQDANFSATHFQEIYNTDLVNTVGNCASRVTAMIGKYFDGDVPAAPRAGAQVGAASGGPGPHHFDLPAAAATAVEQCRRAMDAFDLSAAIAAALSLIRTIDGYINATEPFKVAKDPARRDELARILYHCIEAVRIASLLLWPVMPAKMEALWAALQQDVAPGKNQPLLELANWGGMKAETRVAKVALFPRVEHPPVAAAAAAVS
jgi:methionyl-tRNA synthetase